MRKYLLLLLSSVLIGCNGTSGPLKGSGEVAPAPWGYTYGCATNPDAVACPK